MLVLTHFVAQHELASLRRVISLHDILVGARKVLHGLAIPIKQPVSAPLVRFFKVRIGKKGVARMIVMVMPKPQKVVPVLIRLKKDSLLGTNMAMNNPRVSSRLSNNLDAIMDDIQHKRYQEVPL